MSFFRVRHTNLFIAICIFCLLLLKILDLVLNVYTLKKVESGMKMLKSWSIDDPFL